MISVGRSGSRGIGGCIDLHQRLYYSKNTTYTCMKLQAKWLTCTLRPPPPPQSCTLTTRCPGSALRLCSHHPPLTSSGSAPVCWSCRRSGCIHIHIYLLFYGVQTRGLTEFRLPTIVDKKLIRRWDSERELSLRRHCTRTKNKIDSCINSATDRFLQRKFTNFSEITQCNGHYAVQGHSRSPIWYQSKAHIRLPISD